MFTITTYIGSGNDEVGLNVVLGDHNILWAIFTPRHAAALTKLGKPLASMNCRYLLLCCCSCLFNRREVVRLL